ncbi:MAG: 1,4-alpha-glucan branching enzyme [Rhodothermales bacterium]|jgi:1,4-alpha-glucan branching enzyme
MSPNPIKRKRVNFRVQAQAGSQVFLTGSFNEWSATKKELKDSEDGLFTGYLFLKPGSYEYKFIVDGEWRVDSEREGWTPNSFGSLNSVITVA